MRCAECGREIPDTSQHCAVCAAPVSQQPATSTKPPLGGPDDAIATSHSTDQGTGVRKTSPLALVILGIAVAALVAVIASVIVAVALVASSSGRQLTEDQLRPGDCLTGSTLPLDTTSPWPRHPWPRLFTTVPCTQEHFAEVVFAGNAWPRALTKYPGSRAIFDRADSRCIAAFAAYDGKPIGVSSFTYDDVAPNGASDWASGDRRLVCVAYEILDTPINYSIKGSHQ